MKKSLLQFGLFLCFLYWISISASAQILGGEFKITHLQSFDFEIELALYTDASGPNTPPNASVIIYRRGTVISPLSAIDTLILVKQYDSIVGPNTPGCQGLIVVSDKSIYSIQTTLSPSLYSDSSGYLLFYSAGIRYANFTNVVGGNSSIIALIPPVVDGKGDPFNNSSPSFNRFISEYACTGQLFHYILGGIDPDGDSLAYKIIHPRTSGTIGMGISDPIHAPFIDPHSIVPGITYAAGYMANDAIHGNSGPPDPAVDRLRVHPLNGLVSVTPRLAGTYLYGLVCREYRDVYGTGNKTLIASTYREFLMQVDSNCPLPDTLDGPLVLDSLQNLIAAPGDTLLIPQNPAQVGNRTIVMRVYDNDFDPFDPVGKIARFSVSADNFPDSLISISPTTHSFTSQFDTVGLSIIFNHCVSSGAVPFQFTVITSKGHCPLSYLDSTRWYAIVDTIGGCSYNLSGSVTKAGVKDYYIQGEAYLLQPYSSGQNGPWTLLDVQPLISSWYSFKNVPAGVYYVLAGLYPGDPDYSDFLSTYHISEDNWMNANPISLQGDRFDVEIDLISLPGPNSGPGSFLGQVVDGENVGPGGNVPLEDILVILMDDQGNLLDKSITDVNGDFSFPSLAFGTYQVRVEIPGIPMLGETISISSGSPTEFLHFRVFSNQVILNLQAGVLNQEVSIFPNPVREFLSIEISQDLEGKQLTGLISDIYGKVYQSFKINNKSTELNLSLIPAGVYFIQMNSGSSEIFRRIIKQ